MSVKEQIELARKMLESYSKSHKRLPRGNFTIKCVKNSKRK